jgi:ketosteroid isomerase-like protein
MHNLDRLSGESDGSPLRRALVARYCVGDVAGERDDRSRRGRGLQQGDLDAWLEYFTDDIDYRAVEGAPDDHGPIEGKDALRAYVEDWRETFDDSRTVPTELIDAGRGQGDRGDED